MHLFGSILLQRSASHERIRKPRDNQTLPTHPHVYLMKHEVCERPVIAYLDALSRKFRKYFLLSTSGTIVSVIDSSA